MIVVLVGTRLGVETNMFLKRNLDTDHTSSGKIIKAPLRAIAQKEWAKRLMKE